MTDTDALKKKIAEKGMKQVYIAEKMGLTSYGLANKINNKTEFKSSEIKFLCELLDITSLREKEAIFFNDEVDK
jgi:transcriptional regulator with XRE-family HTH domain